MFRWLILFGLVTSLMAAAQTPAGTTIDSGYVVPASPNAPLLATPSASLPGSGPAPGLPPAVGVNDPRYGGTGSVYWPSATPALGNQSAEASTGVSVGTQPSNTPATSRRSRALNLGIANFIVGSTLASTPEASLADIARRYKADRAGAHPKQFDNNSVRHASYGTAETNSADLPQGDQPSATYGSSSAPTPPGVLNPGDYAAVQAALARGQAQANANAGNNTLAGNIPDPNHSPAPYEESNSTNGQANADNQLASGQNGQANSTQQATTPEVRTQTAADNPAKKQLPATASSLPALAFLGLIVLAVGGVFTQRVRRSRI